MVVHKDKILPGIHPPIVEAALFDAVQASLDANSRRHIARPNRVATAPLTRRIFDADGQPMSPTFSHGARGQVYRYYVSASLQQGRGSQSVVRRVAGPALEAALADALSRLLPGTTSDPLAAAERVEIHPASVEILLAAKLLSAVRSRLQRGETVYIEAADPSRLRLALPLRQRRQGGRAAIETPDGSALRPTPDAALIRGLRAAHSQVTLVGGQPRIERSAATGQSRRLARLAFLAPELQAAILAGTQPAGATLDWLIARPLPLLWRHQIEALNSRS